MRLTTITITRDLADADDLVGIEIEGEDALITNLGMLELARTLLLRHLDRGAGCDDEHEA